MQKSQALRAKFRKSFVGFCALYLPHYFQLKAADFHHEIIDILNDKSQRFVSITGFRGSAKSTIVATAYVLWQALENDDVTFIVPVNETDDTVRLNMANIRRELSENKAILADYGYLMDKDEKKTKDTEANLLLKNGTRIFGRSRGQKIRGVRHVEARPQLIILDDIEELKKIDSKKYRDETEKWLRGTVLSGMDEQSGRCIVIGNFLHNDSIMARLDKDDLFNSYSYPLIKGGKCQWEAKYPTKKALDTQKAAAGATGWQREYLLKIVPEDGQIVKPENIRYYKQQEGLIDSTGIGVDPNIKKAAGNDLTGMVVGVKRQVEGKTQIFITPEFFERNVSFEELIQEMKFKHKQTTVDYTMPVFYFEAVQAQEWGIDVAIRNGLAVKRVKPGADKAGRLRVASIYIDNGTVVFPEKGCERLIEALCNFGIEDHDDLVDAFVYLVLGLMEGADGMPEVIAIF